MMKLSNVLSLDDTITTNLSAFSRSTDFKAFSRMKLPQELTTEDYSRMSKIENRLTFTKNNNFFNYNAHMVVISSDGIVSNVMGNIVSDIDMNHDYLNFKQEFGFWLKEDEWFNSLVRHERDSVWTVPYMYHSSKLNDDKQYVSLARSIKSSFTNEMLGVVMINLDLDNFVSLFTVRSKGSILLLDSQDRIIKSSGEIEIGDINNVKKT